jgi:hypothetical protein
MATRGTITIIYKGKKYKMYNHFDSYYNGLGVDLINELTNCNISEWKSLIDKLIIVDDSDKITDDVINKISKHIQINDKNVTNNNWYGLLYFTQGSINKTLQIGYMLEIYDDEEYNYIVDLDDYIFSCNNIPLKNIRDINIFENNNK